MCDDWVFCLMGSNVNRCFLKMGVISFGGDVLFGFVN